MTSCPAADAVQAVRDLHKPETYGGAWAVCEHCTHESTVSWPCATARLVYTDAEITEATS